MTNSTSTSTSTYRDAVLAFLRSRLEMRACSDAARVVELGAVQSERRAALEAAGRDPLACLHLTATEREVAWIAAGFEMDRELRRLAQLVTAEEGFGLTHDRLQRLCYGDVAASFRELGPNGRLRRLGILERSDGGGVEVHESRQTLAISRRMLAWLHGDESLDAEVASVARSADEPRLLETIAADTKAVREAVEALNSTRALIVARGMPGLGRRTLLAVAAQHTGHRVLEVDAKRLSKDPATLAKQLRHVARECRLLERLPLLCNVDALVDDKDTSRIDLLGGELFAELDGVVMATCATLPQLRWERPVIGIELKLPTSAQRIAHWRALLADASETDAEYLATQYPLAPAVAHRAAEAASARAIGRRVTPTDIEAGIRVVLDDKLGRFAKRVDVTQTWDDIVLPKDQYQCVLELIARIRQRRTVYEQWGFAAKVGKGLGVTALFSGPPGTGKTMVAGLIAKELRLELYQVDMGKVMSKWVGETERHLGELFDAAEAGHAMLLFDEADALFGKRTEVKSANDRFANLETNYLLQRLESFTGICLLTSNHESNIDPAFQRRLSLHLRFQVPDAEERVALWRAMLPVQAPIDPDVNVSSLARRFEMTGGYIRNAALRAAFLAAEDGSAITAAHLEHAAQLEYEGMGKIVMAPVTAMGTRAGTHRQS